jgi:hypothetical protein
VVAVTYDPARTVSDDQDYLDGLNSAVAVELDVNRTGGYQTALGGQSPDYRPDTTFTGLDAEPCRVIFKSAADVKGDDRQGAVSRGRVLFGASIDLDVNHRLVWQDVHAGRTRYLYVDGSSRNAHEMDHHWICDFVEYVA